MRVFFSINFRRIQIMHGVKKSGTYDIEDCYRTGVDVAGYKVTIQRWRLQLHTMTIHKLRLRYCNDASNDLPSVIYHQIQSN